MANGLFLFYLFHFVFLPSLSPFSAFGQVILFRFVSHSVNHNYLCPPVIRSCIHSKHSFASKQTDIMITATSIRRSAPRLFLNRVMAAGRPNAFYSVIGSQAGSQAGSHLQQGWTNHPHPHPHSMIHSYSFSTAALEETVVLQSPGTVTKKLRVLNMDTVKDILKELNAVDRNSDGR